MNYMSVHHMACYRIYRAPVALVLPPLPTLLEHRVYLLLQGMGPRANLYSLFF